ILIHHKFQITDYETSVTGIPPEKVLIAVLRHPFGARQVALPDAARPLGVLGGVDVQDDPRHLGPVGAFCVGIEETEIRDEMLAVVSSEIVSLWSLFGYGRIERRLAHVWPCSLKRCIKSVLRGRSALRAASLTRRSF